jgi:hypothetical protein
MSRATVSEPSKATDRRAPFPTRRPGSQASMSLTIGSGPLAPEAAGTFNARLELPERLVLFDPYLPRARALFEGETVVDSLGTRLLHETGRLRVFYFPLVDVRQDLLEPSARSAEVPAKGTASYHSLRVGDRTAPGAA